MKYTDSQVIQCVSIPVVAQCPGHGRRSILNRTCMQVQVQIIRQANPSYKAPFTNMADCVKQSYAANGFRAPFQGFGATVVRNIPANSVYLGSFEVMKIQAAKHYNCTIPELPAWTVLSAASLGGIMYWLVIFPVDVIKSAMMTDAIPRAQRQYPTMACAAQKLWAEGGVARFYKGFSPCLIRAAPANAAMLYTVDTVNNMLENH
jgi:solute carrier family 25 (mitochondrial carnitine/acylcarnitine transporter), member 20/29